MSKKRTIKIKEKFWAGNQLLYYFIFESNSPKMASRVWGIKRDHSLSEIGYMFKNI